MMTKEGSTKILNFMTLGAGVFALGHGHISHVVKMQYFFSSALGHESEKFSTSRYIVMMTKEASIKIVNLMQFKSIYTFDYMYQYTAR